MRSWANAYLYRCAALAPERRIRESQSQPEPQVNEARCMTTTNDRLLPIN
ncbi:hypothetical protein BRCON_1790 [Candidatus Sumerlaea chitinivorans]|uniref:Uncharacterized protein n=1 Tax=Sumerlaea chitinivorans TaxID=2250252 RepID=A0A2Z4Y5S9_SUMC1|nr:hypothetical protein BRCON_1790 [Candidatus Sumerlaea chitinivorans]